MAKFSIFYPTNPLGVNQGFGVNGEYYRANGINILGHNGIDMRAYHGQPVYAAHDGTAYCEEDNSSGHGVVIVSDEAYDYKDGQAHYKTIYWHFCNPVGEPKYASPIYIASGKKINSGVGIPVKAGDLIGYADTTGLSSGDHLHFGLKPIVSGKAPVSGDSPDVGIGDWVNVDPNNGYMGAIDPTPYFNNFYASNAQAVITNLTQQVSLLTQVLNLFKSLAKK